MGVKGGRGGGGGGEMVERGLILHRSAFLNQDKFKGLERKQRLHVSPDHVVQEKQEECEKRRKY